MRLAISVFVVLLGVTLGVYELIQNHWFAGAGYLFSALLTGGLILFGASFLKESWWGAGLALAAALTGFYGFLFENRGLDVRLDQARFEAAMALIEAHSTCPSADSRALFQEGAQACFLQANRDKLFAVGEAAKQAYLPPQLDLADKVWSSASGRNPDQCQELFSRAYRACPAAFSSMTPATVERLQSQQ